MFLQEEEILTSCYESVGRRWKLNLVLSIWSVLADFQLHWRGLSCVL